MPITINGTTGVSGVAGSAATPALIGTDTNTGIFFPAADTIAFAEGGVEAMRIDSSGNVGIGTSSPANKLHIDPADGGDTRYIQTFFNNAATYNLASSNTPEKVVSGLKFGWYTNYWQIGATRTGGTGIDGLVISRTDAGANTNAVVISSAGNVGIGITAPASKLTVGGNTPTAAIIAGVAAATGTSLALSDNVNSSFYITHPASSPVLFATDVGGGIAIATNGTTERLRIDSVGAITQVNATSGRGAIVGEQTFQLAANGTAIGPGIADFFGATSSINLEASSVYQITAYVVFTKTTAGTITLTMTASSAPTRMAGIYIGLPLTGIGAGNPQWGSAGSQGATTAPFVTTGSLTTGVNHVFQLTMQVQTNAASNWRLQITSSAGTATPLAGSYYTVKKISASTGTFVA